MIMLHSGLWLTPKIQLKLEQIIGGKKAQLLKQLLFYLKVNFKYTYLVEHIINFSSGVRKFKRQIILN